MPTPVSARQITVNLRDDNWVDTAPDRFLYRVSPYEIRLTVMDGPNPVEGATTAFLISDGDDQYSIPGPDTDENGLAIIEIADDDITYDGQYTGAIEVNDSVCLEFPLEIRTLGTSTPAPGITLDWSAYADYTNTATHGPIRAGPGITATTNADGSRTFAASGSAPAYTAITDVPGERLIGRHASGAGNAQAVTVGNGLEFSGSGIQRSALTGDVTASAGSNSTTIANGAVTNAKLANMAESTIKGRQAGSGTGDPEDLTASQARTALGLGTLATQNAATLGVSLIPATENTIDLGSGAKPFGAVVAEAVRAQSVRAVDTVLQIEDENSTVHQSITSSGIALDQLTASRPVSLDASKRLASPTASDFRTLIGLGTIATQAASAVAITGGTISGITDLAVADGGTGASTAADARTALGLAIGTDVLAANGTAADVEPSGTLISAALSDKLSDAPDDGPIYGRSEGAWVEVTGGGGGDPLEVYVPSGSFLGPYSDGTAADCGPDAARIDTGGERAVGVSVSTSNAAQQRRFYEVAISVPESLRVSGVSLSFPWFATSTTTTNCKADVAVYDGDNHLLASESDLGATSANTVENDTVNGMDLTGVSRIIVQVKLYCITGHKTFFEGVRLYVA